jgi:ubiquinone/menaquinone biosynthesis C-methylase UbiE
MAKDPTTVLFETFTGELSERCNASERGIRILCDALTAHGFLAKSGDRYTPVPDFQPFLDRSSMTYIGSVVNFVASDMLVSAFRDLTKAVRRGGTTVPQEGTLAPEHPVWVEFARSMAPLAGLTGQLIANLLEADEAPAWRVLDLAAGHGNFGIALAVRNRRAEIVAQDWENVLEVAKENARKAGVEHRFRTLPGSAFDVDFGAGYDIVLITHFLHHFDPATSESLLRKVHAALAPGGRAVTLEFCPNEDRVSPIEGATFPVVMLATTPAGDAYTSAQLETMFRNAGFKSSELCSLPVSGQSVLISTK